MFILAQGVYTVDISYDWNDTWYDHYISSESTAWAFMLLFITFASWVGNFWLLYVAYESEQFYYIFIYFFSCSILTALSSSSLFENGCII